MKSVPETLSDYFRKIGKKGGKRCLDTMTPAERTTRAKKASAASAAARRKNAQKGNK